MSHETHCCKRHGCKYGDKNCPVVLGNVKQEYGCEYGSDFDQNCFELPPDPEKILEQEVLNILGGMKFEHNVTHEGIINAMNRFAKEYNQYYE